MAPNLQSITDWMIFHKPLYMGRIVRSHTRGGVNFIVEEANENQHRKWFAFNFVDESGTFNGIDIFTHRLLVGRHKLLTKLNQLKYAEDFYASLNNSKVKEILGSEFSSLGGQWIQITGVEDVNTSYAWLVLSPWGKIWISRLAILCLAVSTTDNFTTSDMVDQSAISLNDLPQPMQILASSNLHLNKQGDSTIMNNHTIVSSYQPARKFKSDAVELSVQNTFGYLYGLEQYAAVRGDSLWDPDQIGKTLGRTAITGLATLFTGGGVWGFPLSYINQEWERSQYLKATIPEKVKQQCDDLYDIALIIVEIAENTKDKNVTFTTEKLREAVDDLRKTLPNRFKGLAYDPKSFYNGTPDELRKRYRSVFSQTKTKEDTKQNDTEALGVSEPQDKSLLSKIDTDRVKESVGLGIKNIATNPSKWNPNKWGSLFAPLLAPHAERAVAIHAIGGPKAAIDNQAEKMRETMAEIKVLAREFDYKNNKNKTKIYPEVQVATNIIHSFLVKINNSLPKQMQTKKQEPNYKEVPGVDPNVYSN
jgi:hypothetical protein